MYWQELTTGLYPWDMHDEGVETILDHLQHEAGCNAAYLIGLMHHEKRPQFDHYYHHNPVRKYYITEDSRAYWRIHPQAYANSRIKPLPSERDFLKDVDWLEHLITALHRRGMKAGVEVSHTPLDKQRAAGEFADCIQRDIYGRALPTEGIHIGQQLCWNHPDARAYLCALAADLVRHYDIQFFQCCHYLFNGGNPYRHPLGVTLGGCFCPHCARAAEQAGLNWPLIRRTVRYYADTIRQAGVEAHERWLMIERGDSSMVAFLLERPELYQWLKFRCDCVSAFFRQLSDVVHGIRPDIDLRYNICWREAESIGQDLTRMAPSLDSIRVMDYSEHDGDESRVLAKGRWLTNCRRQMGEDKTIIAALSARGLATPDLIRKAIRTVALHGADGLSFGFYDGATLERLRAIRQGMAEAEIQLR